MRCSARRSAALADRPRARVGKVIDQREGGREPPVFREMLAEIRREFIAAEPSFQVGEPTRKQGLGALREPEGDWRGVCHAAPVAERREPPKGLLHAVARQAVRGPVDSPEFRGAIRPNK